MTTKGMVAEPTVYHVVTAFAYQSITWRSCHYQFSSGSGRGGEVYRMLRLRTYRDKGVDASSQDFFDVRCP